jgi:hypothetical protein
VEIVPGDFTGLGFVLSLTSHISLLSSLSSRELLGFFLLKIRVKGTGFLRGERESEELRNKLGVDIVNPKPWAFAGLGFLLSLMFRMLSSFILFQQTRIRIFFLLYFFLLEIRVMGTGFTWP